MSATTGIQWTDATWNPTVGCERVSPGCAHCYAKAQHDMRHAARSAGKHVPPQYAHPFEVVQLKPERLVHPLAWRAPRRIFVNSVSDLFHDAVPFTYIAAVFGVMAAAQRHTFQVLTKRPARMLEFFDWLPRHYNGPLQSSLGWYTTDLVARLKAAPEAPWPLPNVWLGVSVENQRFADERIPQLLRAPAAVRFLSSEPLLGPVELMPYLTTLTGVLCCPICGFRTNRFSRCPNDGAELSRDVAVDWVIVGGESGKGARSMNVAWLDDLRGQCAKARVPIFVKQMGALPLVHDLTHWRCAATLMPSGDAYLLHLKSGHGSDPAEWPVELRVREFPTSEVRA